VLRETEAVEHNSHTTKFDKIDLESDSTSSTTYSEQVKRPIVEISEGCEEDGLKYLAGFIAKEIISKNPNLGKFLEPRQITSTVNAPSWLRQISYGSLIEPSENFFQAILRYDHCFKKFHKAKINSKQNIVKTLSAKIYKKVKDYDLDIVTAYVKQRTFIRMNNLNHLNSNKSFRKVKTARSTMVAKKTKKVAP
jgi:tyrosyl-tRNA synthetase